LAAQVSRASPLAARLAFATLNGQLSNSFERLVNESSDIYVFDEAVDILKFRQWATTVFAGCDG
jgi:hypothetical protein